MKTWLVARKTVLEIWREPQLLLLVLLTPLFFIVITYVGYGTAPKLATHPVLVISTDPRAEPLIEHLRVQRYADGRPMFDLQWATDTLAAEASLKDKTASVLIVFSARATGELSATLRGDATSMRFITAGTLLGNFVYPYLDTAAGMPALLRFVEQPLETAAPANEFDAYTPGMIVFAILLIIPQTAMALARELRWGTLQRLRLTLVKTQDLLMGVSLAELVLAAGQIVLMFAAALALGFHNRGSLLDAVVVGLGLSFSAIGFGLVVACFSDNDSDALNIGSTATMFQVFMSGAFFALPPLTVFTVAGHEIGLFDFLPATHGMLALQQVLIGGAGLGEIQFRLAVMVGLSLVYFIAGVIIFNQMQMQRGSDLTLCPNLPQRAQRSPRNLLKSLRSWRPQR